MKINTWNLFLESIDNSDLSYIQQLFSLLTDEYNPAPGFSFSTKSHFLFHLTKANQFPSTDMEYTWVHRRNDKEAITKVFWNGGTWNYRTESDSRGDTPIVDMYQIYMVFQCPQKNGGDKKDGTSGSYLDEEEVNEILDQIEANLIDNGFLFDNYAQNWVNLFGTFEIYYEIVKKSDFTEQNPKISNSRMKWYKELEEKNLFSKRLGSYDTSCNKVIG